MSSVRKHYSTDLKVKIVLEILKEEKSVTQLASDHKIHYCQLLKCKKQAMEGLPDLFSDSRTEALKTTHEKEVMALYQEIGQLTTQLAWLNKINIWSLRDVKTPSLRLPHKRERTHCSIKSETSRTIFLTNSEYRRLWDRNSAPPSC